MDDFTGASETTKLLGSSSNINGVQSEEPTVSIVSATDEDLDLALEGFVKEERKGLNLVGPVFMLVFISLCQIVNYFDRGAISAMIGGIGDSFVLGGFEKGMVGGAFMLGYMVFAPMAGFLAQYIRGTRIMAGGLLLWIVAAACASVSWDLWPLLASRMVLGFGEACFASIAPSLIDDICTRKNRTVWLAVYIMAVPVGTALGFIVAGYLSTLWSWRIVFIVEACLMIPFPVIMFFLPNISVIVENGFRKLSRVEQSIREEEYLRTDAQASSVITKRSFFGSLQMLLSNFAYVLTVAGFSCLTFTLGGISFWAPEYFSFSLSMDLPDVTLIFGIISAIGGIVGAISGGLIMDKLGGTGGKWGVPKGLVLLTIFSVPGCICGIVAVYTSVAAMAFPFAVLSVAFVSACLAPVNAIQLEVVPVDLRAFAISLSLFCIHLFGDFPSPVVIGWLKDAFSVSDPENAFTKAMLILEVWCGGAFLFWSIGSVVTYFTVKRGKSFYVEKSLPTEYLSSQSEEENETKQPVII